MPADETLKVNLSYNMKLCIFFYMVRLHQCYFAFTIKKMGYSPLQSAYNNQMKV